METILYKENDEFIGVKNRENLDSNELETLVSLANGKRIHNQYTQLSTEIRIQKKLGAKSQASMIARAFGLGVIITRAITISLFSIVIMQDCIFVDDDKLRKPQNQNKITRIVRL